MSEPQFIYVKERPKTGCLTQVIAAFLVLLLAWFIMSLVSESGSSPKSGSSLSSSSEPTKPVEPDVEVSEIKGEKLEYGGLEITGIVKNKCLVSLNGLSIRFSIFDSKDNKVGEAIDFVTDLEAGGAWKFKATTSESGAHFRSEGVWCSKGLLFVKYLDQELREQREKKAAIEQERQRNAADAVRRLAIQDHQMRQQESARKTFEYYSQKATNGDGFAQLRLGQLYLAGRGVETNIEQARFWLFCAATNGQPEAVNILRSVQTTR